MKHEDLTSRLIAICIKVHSVLGPGLLESVYEEAVCYELDKRDIEYKRQQGIRVKYEEAFLGKGFRADIIVENRVMIEVKSVEYVTPTHYKILVTYLRLSEIEVGLMINFNVSILKDGLKRIVVDRNPNLPGPTINF